MTHFLTKQTSQPTDLITHLYTNKLGTIPGPSDLLTNLYTNKLGTIPGPSDLLRHPPTDSLLTPSLYRDTAHSVTSGTTDSLTHSLLTHLTHLV